MPDSPLNAKVGGSEVTTRRSRTGLFEGGESEDEEKKVEAK